MTCFSEIGQERVNFGMAIGLKRKDGRYYGLKNFLKIDSEHKFSVIVLKVEISGKFSTEEIKGSDGNKYDVIGVIN